ncbi:basic proline-rich protein-like [Tympanuchus pallidicinctus]|uniref:basic proline-rich protein-like n=1 Tax=Tympanuchus pallidicinctus TaxID=109042 RepID=UPI0022873E95|nr:basic proline-rich protein-like [Tympanuchus pallidicinctus]
MAPKRSLSSLFQPSRKRVAGAGRTPGREREGRTDGPRETPGLPVPAPPPSPAAPGGLAVSPYGSHFDCPRRRTRAPQPRRAGGGASEGPPPPSFASRHLFPLPPSAAPPPIAARATRPRGRSHAPSLASPAQELRPARGKVAPSPPGFIDPNAIAPLFIKAAAARRVPPGSPRPPVEGPKPRVPPAAGCARYHAATSFPAGPRMGRAAQPGTAANPKPPPHPPAFRPVPDSAAVLRERSAPLPTGTGQRRNSDVGFNPPGEIIPTNNIRGPCPLWESAGTAAPCPPRPPPAAPPLADRGRGRLPGAVTAPGGACR